MSFNNKVAVILSVALISFSLIECDDKGIEGIFVDEAGVKIVMRISSMNITNTRTDTVRFLAIEQELSTRIDINPSCSSMNTIAPRSTSEVPFSKVNGYHSNCEILFCWWVCAQGTNGKIEPTLIQYMKLKSP